MKTLRLQLTKLDCARRQLETAVKLYAKHGEPVSIHSLASAAYTLLHNINKSREGAPMIKDGDWVKPEYQKEILKKLNEHQNFFKHADKDPLGMIEFDPSLTEGFLYEACAKYYEFTGEKIPYLHAFVLWFPLIHPDYFAAPTKERAAIIEEMRKHYGPNSREQYFKDVIKSAEERA